eukprot:SAG31_NODE_28438_length_410_cov_0.929260_2_plen_34_part_01
MPWIGMEHCAVLVPILFSLRPSVVSIGDDVCSLT